MNPQRRRCPPTMQPAPLVPSAQRRGQFDLRFPAMAFLCRVEYRSCLLVVGFGLRQGRLGVAKRALLLLLSSVGSSQRGEVFEPFFNRVCQTADLLLTAAQRTFGDGR